MKRAYLRRLGLWITFAALWSLAFAAVLWLGRSVILLDQAEREARRAAAMAAALLLIARELRRHAQDAALAAQASIAGLTPMTITLPEISAALRAAALMPISDDGAARIAAGVVAETFWNALRAAWPAAPGA